MFPSFRDESVPGVYGVTAQTASAFRGLDVDLRTTDMAVQIKVGGEDGERQTLNCLLINRT